MIAFVLGNGISRKAIDLHALLGIGPVYGCNAIYRDFTPSVLVATDAPIAEAIQKSGYALTNTFYTRRPLPDLGGKRVPQSYFGYSSGPIAMGLCAMDGHTKIYMIGFDMGPSDSGKFNNVYADTQFYKKSDNLPTFTGNWARQMATIAREHSKVTFTRVFGATTAEIRELQGLANMQKMPIADFVERINKPKDL